MMIPAVVLALVLVAPAFSLPVTTQESGASGHQGTGIVQGGTGFIPQAATTGEKTGIEGVSQIATGIPEGSFIETTGTRAGAGGVPAGVQNVQKVENAGYSQLEQGGQTVATQVYSGTPVQYSGLETVPQVEKTGVQVPSEGYTSQQFSGNYQQNTAVPKVENVPVSVEHQPSQIPLVLPIQPVAVVPVSQVSEFLQPVVVPETAGRVIIMGVEPIQQRNFQQVTTSPEKQVPYQQVVEPVSQVQPQGVHQTVQPLFVQPVQTQEPQIAGQTYIPVQVQPDQVPYVREQTVYNPPQQAVQSVQTYNPVQAVEQNPQVYSAQPSQVVNEYVEKQTQQQLAGYTPGQTQLVQQQSQNVQPTVERQGEYQQVNDYTPVHNQVQTLYQQQDKPVAVENVQLHQQIVEQPHQAFPVQQPTERQTPYQQTGDYIPVQHEQTYIQPAEQQVFSVQPEHQQTYNPVQSQPAQQQVYNVQPEYQQNYSPVESQPAQQQVYNVQPEYQQSYSPVQPQPAEQTQTVHESYEKQVPLQQQIQTAQYIQPHQEEPTYQQQVSSVQSFSGVQPETSVPNQPVQQENTAYVPQHVIKTSEVHQNEQVFDAEAQQVVNYAAEPVYNFGDRIPQNPSVQQGNPVHVLSTVTQNQGQFVNPSVVSTQA